MPQRYQHKTDRLIIVEAIQVENADNYNKREIQEFLNNTGYFVKLSERQATNQWTEELTLYTISRTLPSIMIARVATILDGDWIVKNPLAGIVIETSWFFQHHYKLYDGGDTFNGGKGFVL